MTINGDFLGLFDAFFNDLMATRLHRWQPHFKEAIEERLKDYTHGDLDEWLQSLNRLPIINASTYDFTSAVNIGNQSDTSETTRQELQQQLMGFHPWRKGPFNLFGIDIDTEWRSDWKWDRVLPHLDQLNDRLILDIGCGNGYHCWRMYGQGAKLVVGVDPSQKFLMQFQAVKNYAGDHPVHLIPIGIEYLPDEMGKQGFDTVFSMGVLYHRKSPIEHLQHLKRLLRTGGQLVLETLVVEGGENYVVVPPGRYAQMRNVWFLPSTLTLEAWLKRIGFNKVKTVDVNKTSLNEQRATDWMTFHSLADFLDPNDSNRTVEGLPAPTRAIITAYA